MTKRSGTSTSPRWSHQSWYLGRIHLAYLSVYLMIRKMPLILSRSEISKRQIHRTSNPVYSEHSSFGVYSLQFITAPKS